MTTNGTVQEVSNVDDREFRRVALDGDFERRRILVWLQVRQ